MLRTLEMRYNNSDIKFNNINPISASTKTIVKLAESEKPKILVTGTNENPILIFFDEQQMYRFLRLISEEIL